MPLLFYPSRKHSNRFKSINVIFFLCCVLCCWGCRMKMCCFISFPSSNNPILFFYNLFSLILFHPSFHNKSIYICIYTHLKVMIRIEERLKDFLSLFSRLLLRIFSWYSFLVVLSLLGCRDFHLTLLWTSSNVSVRICIQFCYFIIPVSFWENIYLIIWAYVRT